MSEAVFIDARRPASARIGNLDFADCERIRHNRDAAFDGVIFIAVLIEVDPDRETAGAAS